MVKMNKKERELADELRRFTTPELCDGAGLYHSMDWHIKPWVGNRAICGTAVTVDVPSGEGGLVADAVFSLSEGDVLVVSGKGNCAVSYWGDHRSICASMKKAAGVIIDGAFRDIEGCETVGFPIFAKGLTCGTAGKSGAGAINIPVSCGGVSVHPGDFIAADRNGVIVIRPEEAEQILERALDKRNRQEAVIRKMRETGQIFPKIPGSLSEI